MRYLGTKDSLDEPATQADLGTIYVDPVEPAGTPEGHLWYDEDSTTPSGAAAMTTKVNAGPGLTGGGDLSADRTLAVDFNDPRFFTPPIGVIYMWPFAAPAPVHHLLLDGSIYNIVDFPTLGPMFGSKYGGNGTTTFGVPDARGKFILGVSASHILGSTGGVETVTLTTAQMPAHSHTGTSGVDSPDHAHQQYVTANSGGTGIRKDYSADIAGLQKYDQGIQTGGATARHQHSIPQEGGGGSHENMPPFISMNYIIRAL